MVRCAVRTWFLFFGWHCTSSCCCDPLVLTHRQFSYITNPVFELAVPCPASRGRCTIWGIFKPGEFVYLQSVGFRSVFAPALCLAASLVRSQGC